jgi:hypothetical protein
MSKHTPGPWKVGTPGPNGCPTVGTKGGLMTAHIAHSLYIPDQSAEARCNARLIAAAPDLLHSLKGMLSIYPLPDNEITLAAKAVVEKVEGVQA